GGKAEPGTGPEARACAGARGPGGIERALIRPLRELRHHRVGAERTGMTGRGEAVGGSPAPDRDHRVPGPEIREQELESADLVAAVDGGGPVLALDPELGHADAGCQDRMGLERCRPGAQSARPERRAYLSVEVSGIQCPNAFHRE